MCEFVLKRAAAKLPRNFQETSAKLRETSAKPEVAEESVEGVLAASRADAVRF
jgi:hypothetical protein